MMSCTTKTLQSSRLRRRAAATNCTLQRCLELHGALAGELDLLCVLGVVVVVVG